MKEVKVLPESFQRHNIRPEEIPWDKDWNQSPTMIRLTIKFRPEVRGLAEEWFGPWKINEAGDGSFTVEVDYPENDWLYGFILSFGDKAEVISPDKVREQLHRIASGIVRCYGPSFSSNSSTQR